MSRSIPLLAVFIILGSAAWNVHTVQAELTCHCNCVFRSSAGPLDPIDIGAMTDPEGSTATLESNCTERCTLAADAYSGPGGPVSYENMSLSACEGTGAPITPTVPSEDSGGSTGAVTGAGGSRGAPTPTLPNPLGGTTDIRTIIGRVIKAALGISGSIALLMFVWGGMLWLTSGGSPERIKKGKDAIVWAVLGLVLIFGSYAILNFVLGAILSA